MSFTPIEGKWIISRHGCEWRAFAAKFSQFERWFGRRLGRNNQRKTINVSKKCGEMTFLVEIINTKHSEIY